MTFLILLTLSLLVGANTIALFNLLQAHRLEDFDHDLEREPLPCKVTLLIPVRNERENLGRLLPSLANVWDPSLEILFFDDASTDGSGELLRQFAEVHPAVRVIQGDALPDGWVGKNWACEQLAIAATGRILIFCDADVELGVRAVDRTVRAFDRLGADAITAFPSHEVRTWSERSVLPLILHLPIAALLPLPWVGKVRAPSLSAANGQWFAFRREAYGVIGGHRAVRGEVLEDLALGRRVKQFGLRLEVLMASEDLRVRMYRTWSELREGFGKNLWALLGGDRGVGFSSLLFFFLCVAPFFFLGVTVFPLILLALLRIQTAILFQTSVPQIFWHPVGVIGYLKVLVRAAQNRRAGKASWKGRTVRVVVGGPSEE